MKCVILAAGKGERLQPITSNRSKHMIKICGRPLLEYILITLKKVGITEFIIIINYKKDIIRKYFGNGKKLGLKIEYVIQKKIMGTGDALALVKSLIKNDFLLVYGDLVFSENTIRNLLELYKKEVTKTIISVVPVNKPENYGIVELKRKKYLKRIVEKPKKYKIKTNFANAGIFILSKNIFEKLLQISPSKRGELELTDAISLLLKDHKEILVNHINQNEWIDVGNPWNLLDANRLILEIVKPKIKGIVEKGAFINGPVIISSNARILSGAYIQGPVFIDEGSCIGPNCYIRPYTSIGKNVRIGNACEIKNSIIFDKSKIGHLSYVGDSVIGKDCNLGAGTIFANYRLDAKSIKMKIKGKTTDSSRNKLGSILGDNVKIGINALLMPGVKVANNSLIGPNVVVYKDLSANTMLYLKQKPVRKKISN
jgi:bifunctional UDP-N-acetylglucosamine pyrophosphorylase/glucosamine-1-phosphate N-acetyltransferase